MKTKQTDVNLLTRAWKLSPSEIRVDERIASGAYGEVWKGALHKRWVVAIKKLFHSTTSNSQSMSVSSNKSTSMSKRKRKAKATNELFRDDEIKFLMRTWCSGVQSFHTFMRISIERFHFFYSTP